jgi:hypothetical protein
VAYFSYQQIAAPTKFGAVILSLTPDSGNIQSNLKIKNHLFIGCFRLAATCKSFVHPALFCYFLIIADTYL